MTTFRSKADHDYLLERVAAWSPEDWAVVAKALRHERENRLGMWRQNGQPVRAGVIGQMLRLEVVARELRDS